jgi:hypothetical protein
VFAKQSGSPVRIRTYDPFVYSPKEKCFVLSSNISLQAALRGCESSAQEHRTDAPPQGISCVFLCIFLLLQREMRGYVLQLSSQLPRGM